MKKSFLLKGLDCASCASKMQDGINRIEGVNNATVNFMTAKLVIDGDDDKIDKIVETAKKIIKKIEPDVVLQKV